MKKTVLAAIVAFCAIPCLPATAMPDGDRALLALPTPKDRKVLVQTLVAEAGWHKVDDYPAILHVLERRRHLPAFEGLSLSEVAQAYSAFFKPGPDTQHRADVAAITLETAPKWALKAVDLFYAGRLRDPCRGRATHWGSPEDYAGKTGFLVVDCGNTRNIYTR